MIKLKFSEKYKKMLRILCANNEELIEVIEMRIFLFSKNPNDTRLRNHPLIKRLKGKWSFSVTPDIRIVYEWKGANTVRFLAIGHHEEVYKK